MKTNIALIGFMGVGKTAVGKVLADKLNLAFLNSDSMIEMQAGKNILSIFKNMGEVAFRELEIAVIKELSLKDHSVIDCGGGVVLNTINIDRLRERSIIVLLKVNKKEVIRRLRYEKNKRPLITDIDQNRIISIMNWREPFYDYAADIIVNTSRSSVNAVAEKIIKKLKANEDYHF